MDSLIDTGGEHVVCNDYDLDGWPDVVEVVAQHFTPDNWVVVHHNNHDGTFSDVTSAALTQTAQSDDIAVADVNGDSWPDIIGFSGGCSPTPTHVDVQFFLNNGDGTFTENLNGGVPGGGQGCSRIVPIPRATTLDLLWVRLGVPSTLMRNQAVP